MDKTEFPTSDDPPAVLVIADPGNVSALLGDLLSATDAYKIHGPYLHSVDAVTRLRKTHIDVVVIDMGMVQNNPLVSIIRILKIDTLAKILMVSAPTQKNKAKSETGIAKGAAFYLPIPPDGSGAPQKSEFSRRFIDIVRKLSVVRRDEGVRQINRKQVRMAPPSDTPALRPFSEVAPRAIAIASSTGGPKALHTLLSELDSTINVPVFITQHMPKSFTRVLATNLSSRTGRNVAEASDGERVVPGKVYLAAGDYHMTIMPSDHGPVIKLDQQPPINFCRPSADPMLESIARTYGSDVCLVVLTGMGSDGKNGAKHVIDAGGQVIAQDFDSSVVWGMPGAVSNAGYASKILPLIEIAPTLNALLSSDKKVTDHNTTEQREKTPTTIR